MRQFNDKSLAVRTAACALAIGCSSLLAVGQVQAGDATTFNDSNANVPGAGEMAFDLVVARPLGLVATGLGSVFFVLGLPIEAMSGSVHTAANRMVAEPAKFTFTRPLGEMN